MALALAARALHGEGHRAGRGGREGHDRAALGRRHAAAARGGPERPGPDAQRGDRSCARHRTGARGGGGAGGARGGGRGLRRATGLAATTAACVPATPSRRRRHSERPRHVGALVAGDVGGSDGEDVRAVAQGPTVSGEEQTRGALPSSVQRNVAFSLALKANVGWRRPRCRWARCRSWPPAGCRRTRRRPARSRCPAAAARRAGRWAAERSPQAQERELLTAWVGVGPPLSASSPRSAGERSSPLLSSPHVWTELYSALPPWGWSALLAWTSQSPPPNGRATSVLTRFAVPWPPTSRLPPAGVPLDESCSRPA